VAYFHIGDYNKAIASSEKSLIIAQEIKDRLTEGRAVSNLGATHLILGNYEKSIDYQIISLVIKREIKDRESEKGSLSNIGYILSLQNKIELAITFYKQSINVSESIRQDNRPLSQNLQSSYTKRVASTYHNLADLLLKQNRITEALQVLDLLKVQDLQDFLKDENGDQINRKGIDLLPKETQWLKDFDSDSKILKNFTHSSIQSRSITPSPDLNLKSYQDLQNRIKKLGNNVALFYPLLLDDRIELVILTPDRPPIHKAVPIKRKQLETAIDQFRKTLSNPKTDAKPQAQELYNWLIQPIEAELQSAGVKTIVYAPDGKMRYIPLAALHDGKQWIAERYQVNYLTALSLTQLDKDSTTQPKILAAARTIDLTYSRPEVEQISKDFPNTTALFDLKFDRKSILSSIPNNDIVHLATHATFGTNPDDSFIRLGNTDIITLRELDKINFGRASLVVLSACQTAEGRTSQGLEILGFGYQLQRANVRASIASLWSVNDGGTQILMNAFYGALKTGQYTKVEALQEAQKALITSDFKAVGGKRGAVGIFASPEKQAQEAQALTDRLNHPFYWAPFILIGNGL
jgi:CHAT domain-containing protein